MKLEDFELVPLEYEGYENKMYGFLFGVEEATIGAKIENTWNTCMEFVRMVWMGLSELVSGNVGVKDMAGPVGIVDMMAQTGEQAESVSAGMVLLLALMVYVMFNDIIRIVTG